jgi:hypothetical protein
MTCAGNSSLSVCCHDVPGGANNDCLRLYYGIIYAPKAGILVSGHLGSQARFVFPLTQPCTTILCRTCLWPDAKSEKLQGLQIAALLAGALKQVRESAAKSGSFAVTMESRIFPTIAMFVGGCRSRPWDGCWI